MSILSRARALWWNLGRRRAVNAAFDEELAAYVDLLIAEHQRAGLAPEDARRAALIEIGGLQSTADAARDAWTGNAIIVAARETRQTLRSLRRAPSYVVTVVLTLSLGIGSATALFTVVKGSLLRPLPAVQEPDRLVSIELVRGGSPLYGVSYADFDDFRKSSSLSGAALFDGTSMSFRDSLSTGRTWISFVGGDFFSVLGVRPVIGRVLDSTDVQPGAINPVVVIGYDFWMHHFGGSPDAVGRRIFLDSSPMTIVGVAPKGFLGAMAFHRMDMWIPLTGVGAVSHDLPLKSRAQSVGRLIARLAPGRTIADARAELAAISEHLAHTYVEAEGRSVLVLPGGAMTTEERDESSRLPRLLAVAIGLLLMIACSNVANLSAIRIAERRRELATRLALGASRTSLVGRLMLESGLLAGAAALGGLVIAFCAVRSASLTSMIVSMEAMDLTLDWRVLCLTISVSLGAMLLVTLVSFTEVLRVPVESLLRDGGRAGRRSPRSQRTLVVVQVAASLVLLVLSASVFGTIRSRLANSPGFDARGVSETYLIPRSGGLDSVRRRDFYRELLTRVVAEPSVETAALASIVPPATWASPSRVFRRGEEPPPGAPLDRAEYTSIRAYVDDVSPGFFSALRIPLLLGRDFSASDHENGEPVAVVSASLAAALWPNANPLDRYVVLPRTRGPSRPAMRVVGVVADVRFAGLATAPARTLYTVYRQNWNMGILTLVTRGHSGASVADTLVRDIARSIVTESAPDRATQTADKIDNEFDAQRRMTNWLGAFGAAALLLAALGLYGVIAQTVQQQTKELAVRSALGASPWELVGKIMRDGAMLAGIGAIAGSIAAMAAMRVMHSLFIGLGPVNIGLGLIALAPLIGATLVASYLPARSVVRMDAARVLRAD